MHLQIKQSIIYLVTFRVNINNLMTSSIEHQNPPFYAETLTTVLNNVYSSWQSLLQDIHKVKQPGHNHQENYAKSSNITQFQTQINILKSGDQNKNIKALDNICNQDKSHKENSTMNVSTKLISQDDTEVHNQKSNNNQDIIQELKNSLPQTFLSKSSELQNQSNIQKQKQKQSDANIEVDGENNNDLNNEPLQKDQQHKLTQTVDVSNKYKEGTQDAQNQFVIDYQFKPDDNAESQKQIENPSSIMNQNFDDQINQKKQELIQFQPIVLVTQFYITPSRPSRTSRRQKYSMRQKNQTQVHMMKYEWSSDMIKIKQAKRRKKVLEQQLSQVKDQIDLLENPQKVSKKPKIKQLIKIADDSQANLNAINFVRKMNNERKQKQQRLKMFWQRHDEQMESRLQDVKEVKQYYNQKKRLQKAQQISERIQEYDARRHAQMKMKSMNSAYIQKLKKKTQQMSYLPDLYQKKSQLRRVRNLSQCNASAIKKYNRGILQK